MARRRIVRDFLEELVDDGDGQDEGFLAEVAGAIRGGGDGPAAPPPPVIDVATEASTPETTGPTVPSGLGEETTAVPAQPPLEPEPIVAPPTADTGPSPEEEAAAALDPDPVPPAQSPAPTRRGAATNDVEEPTPSLLTDIAAGVGGVIDAIPSVDEIQRSLEDAVSPGLTDAGPDDGAFEQSRDLDLDGIIDAQDDDVDGDGVVNRIDRDDDGDGLLDGADPDDDADGVRDRTESELVAPVAGADGFLTSDVNAPTSDDIDPDLDLGDSTGAKTALQSDFDPILSLSDKQVQHTDPSFLLDDLDDHGIDDFDDDDIDGDGVANEVDPDDDNDDIDDTVDRDDEGDGLLDDSEDAIREAERTGQFPFPSDAGTPGVDPGASGDPATAGEDRGLLGAFLDELDAGAAAVGDAFEAARVAQSAVVAPKRNVVDAGAGDGDRAAKSDLDQDRQLDRTDDDIDGDFLSNDVDPDDDNDRILDDDDSDRDGDGFTDNTEDRAFLIDAQARVAVEQVGVEHRPVEGTPVHARAEEGARAATSDLDGDGKVDRNDEDIDGDFLLNKVDPDDDGDFLIDEIDRDDDGDGFIDDTEPAALAAFNDEFGGGAKSLAPPGQSQTTSEFRDEIDTVTRLSPDEAQRQAEAFVEDASEFASDAVESVSAAFDSFFGSSDEALDVPVGEAEPVE